MLVNLTVGNRTAPDANAESTFSAPLFTSFWILSGRTVQESPRILTSWNPHWSCQVSANFLLLDRTTRAPGATTFVIHERLTAYWQKLSQAVCSAKWRTWCEQIHFTLLCFASFDIEGVTNSSLFFLDRPNQPAPMGMCRRKGRTGAGASCRTNCPGTTYITAVVRLFLLIAQLLICTTSQHAFHEKFATRLMIRLIEESVLGCR